MIALLLPAVQSAREASRRTHCSNNIKQLSLGVDLHQNSFKHYPSNGWGWLWLGEPSRGSGIRQPGGWIYQTLSFVERSDLRYLGQGMASPLRRLALAELAQSVVGVTQCPSRPSADLCPRDPNIIWRNAELTVMLARSDYSGNGGDMFTGVHDGPRTLAEGDDPNYQWPKLDEFSGIFRQRMPLKPADVQDGLSHTFLIGEKYASKLHYGSPGDHGNDQSPVSGDDWDLVRWTEEPPLHDNKDMLPTRFGSVHASGFHISNCDGSVRLISYSIDQDLFRQLGNREDGEPVETPF